MGDVTLYCLFQGEPLGQSFGVTVSRDKSVSDLRKCIIAECGNVLRDVPVNHIRLYHVLIGNDDDLGRLDLTDHPPLLPRTTIGQLFPEIPGEDDYIIVVNSMMIKPPPPPAGK